MSDQLRRMTVVDPLATAAAAGGGPTVGTAGPQQPTTQAMAPSTVQHPSSAAGSNQVSFHYTFNNFPDCKHLLHIPNLQQSFSCHFNLIRHGCLRLPAETPTRRWF